MECPNITLLCFLMLWVTSSAASPALAAVPVPVPAPVRVGVVLDLRSDMGKKRRACISNALHDLYLKHPSSAALVELHIRDSRGDLATTARAAEDLTKTAQVQAIIWGPQTLTKADHVAYLGRHNHIPVISFSSISPTSCAFWLEDPVIASARHPKFGFTLGSHNITFLDPKIDRKVSRKEETRTTRKGCRSKTELKIAVPKKQGFRGFVNVIDPISKEQNVTGYSIDIFEAAMRNLHPRPCYKFIVFRGTYDELVGNVSLGVYDGAVGDVTITAERVALTDFTMPYTQSGLSMLVLAGHEPNTISWTFIKPLNENLWFATIVFFFYTSFVVWMIELPRNQEYQGSSLRQCCTALYFVFSTLTFSHGQTIRSPLSKFVVVVWCFVVLILVQSYTASLSSILTAKMLRPWVTGLEQLRRSGDFVGYQDDSFVRSFLITQNISESRLRNYKMKEEYAAALKKGSRNGGVSAIVDETPYLVSFLSDRRYENDFKMLECIYNTPGFGFAFRLGSPLVHNLSTAILNLARGDEGSQIEAKWFGTASPPMGTGMLSDTDSGQLTLQSFSGLFVITGSVSTLMLLISIVRLVYAKCTSLRKDDVESVSYIGVNEDSHPLHNGTGENPSPNQQPLHGAGNDDSRGVNGSGDYASDREPEQLQHNDIQSGTVSAGHVQIEMSNV